MHRLDTVHATRDIMGYEGASVSSSEINLCFTRLICVAASAAKHFVRESSQGLGTMLSSKLTVYLSWFFKG